MPELLIFFFFFFFFFFFSKFDQTLSRARTLSLVTKPRCWSISHLHFTMSHNQQIYYPKEDDNDQQRFFAWNSQAQPAANRLDDGHQRYDNNGFGFPNFNPLAVA